MLCVLPGNILSNDCCAGIAPVDLFIFQSNLFTLPFLIAALISFSVACLPSSLSKFITSVTDLFLFCWNIILESAGAALLPKNVWYILNTPSPRPCAKEPNTNSCLYKLFMSSLSCNWKPSMVSITSSSTALPAVLPEPAANILANTGLFVNAASPFTILACGDKPMTAPITGPAIPAKSDRSPVLKLKSFSSIIVFWFMVVPSVRVTVLISFSKPSCFIPYGVKAICPLVFLVKPNSPTSFNKKFSCSIGSFDFCVPFIIFCIALFCSSVVSAIDKFLRNFLLSTPVS